MSLSQGRQKVIGRLGTRKTREREGKVLVEGVRAVSEALAADAAVHFAVTSPRLRGGTDGLRLDEALRASGVEVVLVEDSELADLSRTEHHQGVLMVVEEPAHALAEVAARGRLLVLDAVQDPGNVGTLVRAAVAFALDGILALDGTVDPWGAKAVRASAGTVFRVPVLTCSAGEALEALADAGVSILAAEAGGTGVVAGSTPERFALVLGNEGAGVRDEVRAAAHATLSVPMPGPAESLNVAMAGTVLLYALTQES